MKTSKFFLPLIALFFFISSSVSSFGQSNVGLIPVEILLPYDGHHDYWEVTFKSTEGGNNYTFNTTPQNNSYTHYNFQSVIGYIAPGSYTVSIQASGWNWYTQSPVELTAYTIGSFNNQYVYDQGTNDSAETPCITVDSDAMALQVTIDYLWY